MKITLFSPKLEAYLISMEKPVLARVRKTLDLLEKFSYQLRMPYSKQIRSNLYELRIKGEQEIRIFYCFHKSKIVLLHAFLKKSQKTPEREIRTALTRIEMLTTV